MATPRPLPAPARLGLVLPWLNDRLAPPEAVRRCLATFLSETARAWGAAGGEGFVVSAPPEKGSPWRARRLARLREELIALLGLASPSGRRRPEFRALPSLRWDVVRAISATKLSALSARERRVQLGPGAFRIVIRGELRDLLVYCVIRTLTEPGSIALLRCPAPAPRHWANRCDRWFVATGRQRGRPREYCSLACRVRAHARREHEAARTTPATRQSTRRQ